MIFLNYTLIIKALCDFFFTITMKTLYTTHCLVLILFLLLGNAKINAQQSQNADDVLKEVAILIGTQHKIWLTGLFATSDIFMQLSTGTNLRSGDQDTKNGTDIAALGLHWQALFSDRAFGTLTLGYVSSRFRTDVDSITARSDGGRMTVITLGLFDCKM
jgi:hypothetical protein